MNANAQDTQPKGPHGDNCGCSPEEAAEMKRNEQKHERLAALLNRVLFDEADTAIRLTALVEVLAEAVVAHGHTDGKLVLDDVQRIRNAVPGRLADMTTIRVLDRIAADPKTVVVSEGDSLNGLLGALRTGRARVVSEGPLGSILAQILRGPKG